MDFPLKWSNFELGAPPLGKPRPPGGQLPSWGREFGIAQLVNITIVWYANNYSHPQIDGKVNHHQISRDFLFHLFKGMTFHISMSFSYHKKLGSILYRLVLLVPSEISSERLVAPWGLAVECRFVDIGSSPFLARGRRRSWHCPGPRAKLQGQRQRFPGRVPYINPLICWCMPIMLTYVYC